ncbi:FtsX-like permease family protein [Actinocrispum wychmicini]|uniref:FtsX-like permease family protein n=1 Tax=Actinocrispum wychmicini TaxID=1213861 RepID=A0A4R2K0J2_9PSEU|nr:FtsX-like permease family protein [Actinocrispum wychmicini]TCO59835.1 FtsX-like permease family protein [Actinocrispum wychmicini]
MISDFALGLRLAVGGSRSSGQALLRLAMTTIGIALVVSVLLPAVSIGSVVNARTDRSAANQAISADPSDPDPLYQVRWSVRLPDGYVEVHSVSGGPNAPMPPGLTALPGPGDLVVSPAVAELLASPDGAPLRARLPGRVVGVIGKPGLVDASDRKVWAGAPPEETRAARLAEKVGGFGRTPWKGDANMVLLVVLLPILVALLLPLLVFVTTASRMGAAQRERRLAAVRLIGLDARQIRRVAAAESLLGAAAGVVVGGVLFFLTRQWLGSPDLFGFRVFGEDFLPPWPLVVLIVLLVPALAVGAAIFGLRNIIVEPLGVVRQGRPARRLMWWRWTVTGIGALLVTGASLVGEREYSSMVALTAGSALVLVGVAVLLPWMVERVAGRLRGGPPSWQFAISRLQVDSGTASRVVSGLVVVLAGAIMTQVLLTSTMPAAQARQQPPALPSAPVMVETDLGHQDDVLTRVKALPGIDRAEAVRKLHGTAEDGTYVQIEVGSCAALALRANLGSCVDGDVFAVHTLASERPGKLRLGVYYSSDGDRNGPLWTVPAGVRDVDVTQAAWGVQDYLVTTGAAVPSLPGPVDVYVGGSGTTEALSLRVATAVSGLAWLGQVSLADPTSDFDALSQRPMQQFRAVLLAASMFVLMVAALSLLILSIEQITDRRRALAALSAAGVPLGVMARSSLWQTALPVLIGVVLAIGAGIGLSAPILTLAEAKIDIDPPMIGALAGAALLAVLIVTACTLPLLRQVTKVESLRAE